jgi:hypothetical protein
MPEEATTTTIPHQAAAEKASAAWWKAFHEMTGTEQLVYFLRQIRQHGPFLLVMGMWFVFSANFDLRCLDGKKQPSATFEVWSLPECGFPEAVDAPWYTHHAYPGCGPVPGVLHTSMRWHWAVPGKTAAVHVMAGDHKEKLCAPDVLLSNLTFQVSPWPGTGNTVLDAGLAALGVLDPSQVAADAGAGECQVYYRPETPRFGPFSMRMTAEPCWVHESRMMVMPLTLLLAGSVALMSLLLFITTCGCNSVIGFCGAIVVWVAVIVLGAPHSHTSWHV